MAPRKKQLPEEQVILQGETEKEKPAAKKTASKKEPAKKMEIQKKPLNETALESAADEKSVKKELPGNQPGLDRGAMIIGGGLLVIGLLLLVGRLLSIPFGDFLWPFIFIVPGVLVFAIALSTDDRHGEGMSILGSIFTMLGLVFLAQSITGFWASWAYIWALVAPTSIGLGQMIYGTKKDRDSITEAGRRLMNLGLFMFAVGFVFFELIIGISGFGLSQFGLPVFPLLLIFAGLFVLVRSVARNR